MNTRKSTLYPRADLSGKQHYKSYVIIERDGSIIERVFLDIPFSRLRERIICRHYLSRRVKLFYKQAVEFKVLNRDSPWDFDIKFNTGEKFNVEITSIAEDPWIFEMLKREERILLARQMDTISIREYLKVSQFFQGNEQPEEVKSLPPDLIVKNPFKNLPLLMIGEINDERPQLNVLLKDAIVKKQQKKHEGKERTVLLIDNRTFRYELDDIREAITESHPYFSSENDFMEIWLYTGYYSSLDGNDAEYLLCPLKISEEQQDKMNEYVNQHPDDVKDGVVNLE